MPSYNHVALMGNMTRDPELRYTSGGTAVAEFSLAINRRWTDRQSGQKKEEVSFIDCVVWARAAEVICEYMKKGNAILVDGELRQERWQDQQSGQNRSKVKVHVKSFQFVGGKQGADAQQQPQQAAQGASEAPPPGDDIPW